MRVLLVEPYYSGSHRSWADGLVRYSTHDVELVTHAGNFWRWRLRGGAVTLAELIDASVATSGKPDAVLVSDMVNVAALLGLARRSLDGVPVVVYLHENQLMYPLGPNAQPDEAFALVNWVSLTAADEVWVNSQFQLDGLVAALKGLLGRAPDHPHRHRLDDVVARMRVVPVGVELGDVTGSTALRDPGLPPRVLWNQRWDHDKNPAAVFRALRRLAEEGVDFRLSIVGENQRVDPQEFTGAREDLASRVDDFGWLDRAAYVNLLSRSDVVVSAALHEFFGIAIVEAVAAGAVPVLPDRQSYPEVIPERFHDAVLYGDGALTSRLREVLLDPAMARERVRGLADEMQRFGWPVVGPVYDEGLADAIRRAKRHR